MATQPLVLESETFHVECCPVNGSITRIARRDDPNAMNWVAAPAENSWHVSSSNWGLGLAALPKYRLWRWDRAEIATCAGQVMEAHYRLDDLSVTVTRRFDGAGRLTERYVVDHQGAEELALGSLGVYAPFNDSYPSAAECMAGRCHAHLWMGDDVAWVNALAMSGGGPNLGLMLTEGYLSGYSIEHRDTYSSSNIRGDIMLMAVAGACPAAADVRHRPVRLRRGEPFTLAWTLFWNRDWDDFFAQARGFERFVDVRACDYTVTCGQAIRVSVQDPAGGGEVRLSSAGTPLTTRREGKLIVAEVTTDQPGWKVIDVEAGGRHTYVTTQVVRPVAELIRRRVAFIVEHQQVNDPADPMDGAFLPYDNQAQRIERSRDPNHNEGCERLAMGVLLALYLRLVEPDAKTAQALSRYWRFVSGKLQDDTGRVFSNITRPARLRLYNYPWVAHLHLAMHRLSGQKIYLEHLTRTLGAYYRDGGATFYCIGLPVTESLAALEQASMSAEHRATLDGFLSHAQAIVKKGINYPKHEVNFEQSIVGPAADFLLQMAQATGEQSYLEEARPHLRLLEAFGGRQPDFRLHDIGIRHWDGYWFGKLQMWGDIFPHYWSTLTAVALARYGRLTGDEQSLRRARANIHANLCQFNDDGSASCAYVYPLVADGRPGRLADPLANDQDWTLVYYLTLAEEIGM